MPDSVAAVGEARPASAPGPCNTRARTHGGGGARQLDGARARQLVACRPCGIASRAATAAVWVPCGAAARPMASGCSHARHGVRVRELVLRRRCGPGPRGMRMHGAPAGPRACLTDPRTVHSSLRLRARSRNMSESDTRHPAAVPTWCRGRISRHSRCRYLLGITSYQRPTCGLQNNPKDDKTIPENSFPEAEKSRKGR